MSPIRILIADDHTLFRRGLASLLASHADFEVVGEATDGAAAVDLARELAPDVILMDLSMPTMDGIEATRRIKSDNPAARIIIISALDDERKLLDAVKSGAQGYLLKKISPEALFDTLRGALHGEASVSRAMAARILEEFAAQSQRTEPPYGLSDREREVLALLASGMSNKRIANALAIAENTVKNHLKSILRKLHVDNRVEAAAYANREGLATRSASDPD